MRLVGPENLEAGTLEGRVEVCINNAWGTVCDNFFGQEDAETVCASIGGFYSTGEYNYGLIAVLFIFTCFFFRCHEYLHDFVWQWSYLS